MPYFTLQITQFGPMLNAFVWVSEARKTTLDSQKIQVPKAVPIRGLVDTGASCTCIDTSVLKSLGLSPTGTASMSTPSTGATPHVTEQYDVSIIIPGATNNHAPLAVGNLPVIACDLLQAQGIHALIGRDILADCLLSYDGGGGFFTLAY